ncbi:hypothetical protein HYX70_03725 [Candidatus Saccharibacteria bacterium]|nr:hypothetical protein [Candidatus Saccharibacteria bacterium]
MLFTQILIGIGLIAAGTVGLVFSRQIFNFTGRISAIENRFPGSSSGFIKLVAVVMVLAGIVIATGAINWLFGPIGGYFNSTFRRP